MNEITFYGQDFTRISEAKVKVKGPEGRKETKGLTEPIDGCDNLTYIELLEQFVKDYKIPKEDSDDEAAGKSLHSYFNNEMWFGRWVGVFRNKKQKFKGETYDVTLEISCRFDTDKNAYFLLAMLLCLMGKEDLREHFIKPEVNISLHQVMDVFLLVMFKNQLVEAAKKGIFRRYQRFENNDSRPHGTIDIARHIRENMGLNNGRISYHYRELTANNPVNRLILAAYKRLCETYPQLCETHINQDESVSSTLNMLQTELGWSKTSLRNIVKDNLRPVTHPYFSEYEALRRTCLKILRDEGVSIFDADDSEETDALYFDITWLWEKYLEFQFNRLDLKSRDLELKSQETDKFLTSEQDGAGINKEAKPDFRFKKGGKNIAILDAKFKPQWKKRSNDYLTADIDECIRNLVVFWTGRTGVIYPTNDSQSSLEELNIVGKKTCKREYHKLFFDVVEVAVPAVPETGDEGFGAWNEKLDKNVSDILSKYLTQISMDTSITSQQ